MVVVVVVVVAAVVVVVVVLCGCGGILTSIVATWLVLRGFLLWACFGDPWLLACQHARR